MLYLPSVWLLTLVLTCLPASRHFGKDAVETGGVPAALPFQMLACGPPFHQLN